MSGHKVAITEFISGCALADIPPDALHMARRCVVDTLGVWAAGSRTRPSLIARNHAARRYAGSLQMPFDGRTTNPVGLAFAGAATIDAVDGHDGHQSCKGHASVALLPSLLAEQDALPARDMEDLLVDFIVGSEIALRAGLALHASAPDYHSSGAWNALGCAAIGARCRQLSAEQTWHALGIAEYYCPRAQMMRSIDHPTMGKDSSAWGALAGGSAVDLAEDGFTGAPALTCSSVDVSDIWDDLGSRWRILETNFKAYPVCRWAHPAIEGIRALKARQSISAAEIKSIEVATFNEAMRLSTPRPIDGDAAQYSLPLCVALAVHEDVLTPDMLLPAFFDQPTIWATVDQVQLKEKSDYNAVFPTERLCDVTLHMSDGQILVCTGAEARGNFDAPLSDAELVEKFHLYAASALTKEQRDRTVESLTKPGHSIGAKALFDPAT